VAVLAAGAFLLWVTRGLTFLQDEWDFIQGRWIWTAEIFLVPHNQHLLATEVLIYKVLFAAFGIDGYLPYRILGIAIHLSSVALLFEVARRRVGDALGAAVAALLAVLGCGWFVLLYPFNIQWSLSAVALLGIVLLLDRDDRRYDVAIAGLLLLALASSSLGVPMAAGVLARLLLRPADRRRIWVVLLPAALYGAWFLEYGIDADRRPGFEITASPVFLFHLAAGAVGGVAGVPMADGDIPARTIVRAGVHLAAVGLVLLFAIAAVRLRDRRDQIARLTLPVVTLAAFWLVLTATRGYQHAPYSTHYVYVGVLLVILIALELADGWKPSRRTRLWLAAALCASALLNAAVLIDHAGDRRADSEIVDAEIGAMMIAGDDLPSRFKPDSDPERATSVIATRLLVAADHIDSRPGATPDEIASASPVARAAANRVLAAADLRPIPAP
jgi:hypothetical protein